MGKEARVRECWPGLSHNNNSNSIMYFQRRKQRFIYSLAAVAAGLALHCSTKTICLA